MPTFDRRLRYFGAAVECTLAVPPLLAEHMRAMGKETPKPIPLLAMIDSGSATSVLEPEVIETFGMDPVDSEVVTPIASAPREADYYEVLFLLPDGIEFETRAVALPIGLRDVQAILGRDLLNPGVFVYDGLAGKFTFTLPD